MRACGVTEVGGRVEALDLPDPDPPGAGQVVVAVEAAGVGSWDRLLYTGGWDVGLVPPAALGVEGTGRVVAVGEGVEETAEGDAVLAHEVPLPGGSGFWAERVLLTASALTPRPDALDPETAAALPVAGLTARQAIDLLSLEPGQRLLITGGAGVTGALALQLAVAADITVSATASESSAARLRELGAAEVADYHDRRWTARLEGGFDAALVAAPGTADEAMGLVRDGGLLCSLTSDAPPPRRDVASTNLYVRPDPALLADLADDVVAGRLRLTPEAMPLDEGPSALRRVVTGRAGGRKLVLVP
ncbi:alcohol dehydrogenase catalytic domain-containing protein [Actinoallomurus iriomotensis]|uniref:Oxidoreductase n=1 Tax=Actinoallomurus iriomotensis TaxID=478107 RepID=A0A9W6W1C1_9ACTN|nr:zinc-binding dehydrogenase [Actinoallomurus iriomotensis]GLY75947.1 oxidoreductase [Actinoallomurus iriomotensis]GLY87264.1 oxidoreductase [Actinoallomurus iriomotensis]